MPKPTRKCRACGKTYTGWHCPCRRKARNAARRKRGYSGGGRTVRTRFMAVPSMSDYIAASARSPMPVDEVAGFTVDDAVEAVLRRFVPPPPNHAIVGLREYMQANPFTNSDDWYKGAAIAMKPVVSVDTLAKILRPAMWVQMDLVRARLARERLRTVLPESVAARMSRTLADYKLSPQDLQATWVEAVEAWDETIAEFGTGWGIRWVEALEKRRKIQFGRRMDLAAALAIATADALMSAH